MALTLCRTRARYRVLKSITLCRGEDEIVAIGTHQLGGHHEREGIQLISARLGSARLGPGPVCESGLLLRRHFRSQKPHSPAAPVPPNAVAPPGVSLGVGLWSWDR